MQTLAIVIAIVGLIIAIVAMLLWLRTEANADRREINNIVREDRRDMLNMINAIRADTASREKNRGVQ